MIIFTKVVKILGVALFFLGVSIVLFGVFHDSNVNADRLQNEGLVAAGKATPIDPVYLIKITLICGGALILGGGGLFFWCVYLLNCAKEAQDLLRRLTEYDRERQRGHTGILRMPDRPSAQTR